MAFQKYCQLLDVILPIIFKYEVSCPLVSRNVLKQKAKLETLLSTTMDTEEDTDSKYIFDKGQFLSEPEDPNTIYYEDLPF